MTDVPHGWFEARPEFAAMVAMIENIWPTA
jgi:hypothetical protein